MKHCNVVAAVVVVDGKYLCMQKGATKYSYTSWKFEFPGGKIEEGETPQQALQRELMEEMAYEIVVDEELIVVHHFYPDFSITMAAYLCHATHPHDFVMKEHTSFKWLTKGELASIDWAAADVKIVRKILED